MNNLTLGQKISTQRKLAGLSQEMLAEKMEVSRQAVSKWESDVTIPDVDKLIVLSRLFSVSVGWLLGVEPVSDPANTLSEDQMKTIEKMIASYVPKKIPIWRKIVFLLCTTSLLAVCFCLLTSRMAEIAETSFAQKEMIESLASENQQLYWQFQQLNDRLSEKMSEERVLNKVKSVVYLSDLEGYVDIELQLTPMIYQESNTAYIHIWNAENAYKETVACSFDQYNGIYQARFTMPSIDGCEFRFMLVNEYGYEQEDLLLWDPGYAKLGTYSRFHLASECQVPPEISTDFASEQNYQAVYSFHEGIHTPHFFAKTAVAYKDINIELQINGNVIWRKSYLKDFEAIMNGGRLNAADQVLWPNISVTMQQLNSTDEIKLVLTAETVNGGAKTQKFETVLDYHIVP